MQKLKRLHNAQSYDKLNNTTKRLFKKNKQKEIDRDSSFKNFNKTFTKNKNRKNKSTSCLKQSRANQNFFSQVVSIIDKMDLSGVGFKQTIASFFKLLDNIVEINGKTKLELTFINLVQKMKLVCAHFVRKIILDVQHKDNELLYIKEQKKVIEQEVRFMSQRNRFLQKQIYKLNESKAMIFSTESIKSILQQRDCLLKLAQRQQKELNKNKVSQSKLMQLLQAIRKRGIDVDQIYRQRVKLNEVRQKANHSGLIIQ